jgi:hypothetical protein
MSCLEDFTFLQGIGAQFLEVLEKVCYRDSTGCRSDGNLANIVAAWLQS